MYRGYWRVAGDNMAEISDPWQLFDDEEDSPEYHTVTRRTKHKSKFRKRKMARPKIINIMMKPSVPDVGMSLPRVSPAEFAQYNNVNAIVNVGTNNNARNKNFAEGLRPLEANCITDKCVSSLFRQYLKLTTLRSTPRYAATPPSTHQNVELFTSRSSDAVHTTKLYPGDDLQVIGGEGRRSGGDAGSRSPSTRSYDRNCNGKGNQLHETLSSQNALLSPTTTNNQFKPIGARNELLNSQLHANNHFHAALNSEYGCGVEGLVATGNNAMTMQRNGRCLYVNGLSSPLTQNAPVSMRRTNKPSMGTSSSVKQVAKEVEPKYADPFQGAPHDFQQRIAELASLEAETIRTERYRKAKRKTRTDKDS